jgi:glycosyltransferase involved in cell wall biosynthesis
MQQRLHIYLSSNFWDGLWIIQQPIANEIGKTENVLYVERVVSIFTILRYPALWRCLFAWLRGVRPGPRHVHLLAPLPLFHLGHRFPRLFALEMRVQAWWIARAVRRFGESIHVLWIDNPVYKSVVNRLTADLRVYHVADEMSAFDTSHPRIVHALEKEVLERVDVVFAAAEQLSIDKRRTAARVHTVWNAIDTEVFLAPSLASTMLESIAAPRIAFVGVVDSWVDLELLSHAAHALPDLSFVIIGPSVVDLGELRSLANVHLIGRRPRSEIPQLLRSCAASLIPFRRSPLTERIVPLKVFEALAAGIVPIASDFSPDLSVLAAENRLKLAKSAREFVDHIRTAVTEDTPERRKELREYGLRQNWTERWKSMDGILRALESSYPNDPITSSAPNSGVMV